MKNIMYIKFREQKKKMKRIIVRSAFCYCTVVEMIRHYVSVIVTWLLCGLRRRCCWRRHFTSPSTVLLISTAKILKSFHFCITTEEEHKSWVMKRSDIFMVKRIRGY